MSKSRFFSTVLNGVMSKNVRNNVGVFGTIVPPVGTMLFVGYALEQEVEKRWKRYNEQHERINPDGKKAERGI